MSAIAIVHPGTLVGKELRESLENRLKSWRDIRLLSTDADEVGVWLWCSDDHGERVGRVHRYRNAFHLEVVTLVGRNVFVQQHVEAECYILRRDRMPV